MSENLMEMAARQQLQYKQYEQEHPEMDFRSGEDYIISLAGLKHYFAYIRHFSPPRVLDIGGGDTSADKDLSLSEIGKGIDFHATTLTPRPVTDKTLSRDKIIITPAETLEGVETQSCGGAISCYGVAYSEAPELVADSLNRVLKHGGIFKGAFPAEDSMVGTLKIYSPAHLKEQLAKLGFGVYSIAGFLTAIKGGSNVLARDLFEQDMLDFSQRSKSKAANV